MKRAAKHDVYLWKISSVIMEKCHDQKVIFAPCVFYTEIISYWQFSWLKQKRQESHIHLSSWQSSQLKKQWTWNHMIFDYEWNSLSGWEIQMHQYLGGHIQIIPFRMIKNTFQWSPFLSDAFRYGKAGFTKQKILGKKNLTFISIHDF